VIAYYFRFPNTESKYHGWIGFAVAKNKTDLFWEIDQFGDPFECEIKVATRGGYSKFIDSDGIDHWSCSHNFSNSEPNITDDGWKKSCWDGIIECNLEKIDKRQAKQLGKE
jgi:hypothetical protein